MSRVTYTGTTGPGSALTAQVFNDVTCLKMDFNRRIASITYGTPSKTIDVTLTGIATLTDTITSNDHVIVISS